MTTPKETRQARKFRQAIRRARVAWGALRRAEGAMIEAWNACTDEERRGVAISEFVELLARDAREFFRNFGA